MSRDSRDPAFPPVRLRLLDDATTFDREPDQQLRSAQLWPAAGSGIEHAGEFVGLGDEVPEARAE